MPKLTRQPRAVQVRRNIRAALLRADMTQAELVEKLNVNQSWLTRRLSPSNPAPISFDELDLIAAKLNTTFEELTRS